MLVHPNVDPTTGVVNMSVPELKHTPGPGVATFDNVTGWSYADNH